MKRGIFSKTGLTLLFLLIVCSYSTVIFAETVELDLQRDKPIPAKVLEIIEANVYKLLIYDNNVPRVETYGLIGVKPNGNQAAYDYSVKKLLNQPIYFLEDSHVPAQNGMHYCYLYVDLHISHNEDLIKRGFALADPDFKSAKDYLKYSRSQDIAKSQSLGLFDFSDKKITDRILNINVASIDQLMVHFEIDKLKASRWFARIAANPINRLAELRALDKDYFTHEVILAYAPSIHLRTNLNTASPYEITSLVGRISDNSRVTDQILQYRLFNTILNEDDFKKMTIPENYRKAIYPYITFTENYHEFSGDDSKIINLNTANETQIANALGLNSAKATILKSFSNSHSYPLRNVEELFKPHFPLNKEIGALDILSDKIRMYTNINLAGENEIRSLFGKISMTDYHRTTAIQSIMKKRPFHGKEDLEKAIGKSYTAKIISFIYFDQLPKTDFINLNTSGKEKIATIFELTASQKAQLKTNYLAPGEIPTFLGKHMDKITLYTNINQASLQELYNLVPNMKKALAEDIIKYRTGDGYYTLDDVQKLFEKHNFEDTFHKIKRFLILQ